jgi:hypothetical protein
MRSPAALVLVLGLVVACDPDEGEPTSDGASTQVGETSASSDDAPATTESSSDPSTTTASADEASTTASGVECVDDEDCRLVNDCCTCEAILVGEEPPTCDLDCARPLCDLWGTGALCSHTCRLRLVKCDPALIMCADDPPTCEEGFQPAIEDRCWTQQCVPVELCTPY